MKPMTVLKAVNEIDDDYILEAAPKGYLPKEKPAFGWLNMRALATAAAVILLAVFFGISSLKQDQPDVTVVTPYKHYETMEEVKAVTGFAMECPETYKDSSPAGYAVYGGSMIEAQYISSDEETVMNIRKAKEAEEDISGDYTAYDTEIQWQTDGITYTAKGNDGLYHLILWQNGEYSYSVNVSEGISEQEAGNLAGVIR